MVESVTAAVARLFVTSSPWRQSVFLAVIGGVILVSGMKSNTDEPQPKPVPIPTMRATPFDSELAAYRISYQKVDADASDGTIGSGTRCERILVAFNRLPPSLQSSKDARVYRELQEGNACQELIASSNAHLNAVRAALNAAIVSPSRETIEALGHVSHGIDGEPFDNTRSAYADVHVRAMKYIKTLQDTDAKFDAIAQALQSPAPTPNRVLMQATSAIAPIDEGLATPEQKAALRRARQAMAQSATRQLDAALETLRSNRNLANMLALLDLSRIVTNAPPDGATPGLEPAKLDAIRSVENEISGSDSRLKKLIDTVSEWNGLHNPSTCEGVNTAVEALQSLDKTRLAQPQGTNEDQAAKAFTQFATDDFLLHGNQKWEDLNTRKRVPIFLSGRRSLVRTVTNALRNGGFNTTPDEKVASLIVEIVAKNSKSRTQGQFSVDKFDTEIDFNGRWICGQIFEAQHNFDGTSGNTGIEENAATDAVAKLVGALNDTTVK